MLNFSASDTKILDPILTSLPGPFGDIYSPDKHSVPDTIFMNRLKNIFGYAVAGTLSRG